MNPFMPLKLNLTMQNLWKLFQKPWILLSLEFQLVLSIHMKKHAKIFASKKVPSGTFFFAILLVLLLKILYNTTNHRKYEVSR